MTQQKTPNKYKVHLFNAKYKQDWSTNGETSCVEFEEKLKKTYGKL